MGDLKYVNLSVGSTVKPPAVSTHNSWSAGQPGRQSSWCTRKTVSVVSKTESNQHKTSIHFYDALDFALSVICHD